MGNGEGFASSPYPENSRTMLANKEGIRDLKQWVCWRTEERDSKPTKVPYSPLTGRRADSTDSKT
jgi:hypothetical protein